MAGTSTRTPAPASAPRPPTAQRRRTFSPGRIALYLVLILIALFFVIPLVWMVSTSLKVEADVFRDRGFIPAEPELRELPDADPDSGGQTPVFRWMFNSVGVATIGTAADRAARRRCRPTRSPGSTSRSRTSCSGC